MRAQTATLLALLAVACQTSEGPLHDLAPQPPAPVHLYREAIVRFHMRGHLQDLRAIQDHLLFGNLEAAQVLAILVAQPVRDPGLLAWKLDLERVSDLVYEVATAPSIDEALRREAKVAVACAECHMSTQRLPKLATGEAPPKDLPTTEARMLRHLWATDRLWEGLIGGSENAWRDGLQVLAVTPLPISPALTGPDQGPRLQALAREALAQHATQTETLDERGRLYGEMLVGCAACHAKLQIRR